MKVTFVHPDGAEQTVDAESGDSLMQTAMNNSVKGIVAECGGSMSCATCHVYVDNAWAAKTGTRSESEEDMLDCAMSEMRDTSRLSCQITMSDDLDGLRVHIALEQA
jgi:2Fe-2S ferredoxin